VKRLLPLFIGLLTPFTASAVRLTDYGFNCDGFLYCDSGTDVTNIIASRLVTAVGAFILSLAVVVFMYGGLRMTMSRGEEGKEAGKKALIYASLGLVLALLTGAIINYIFLALIEIGG